MCRHNPQSEKHRHNRPLTFPFRSWDQPTVGPNGGVASAESTKREDTLTTTTQSEVTKLMEMLENAYWRLKELGIQDLEEDKDLEEKVDGIITDLDQYFA
jgi:tRNA A58 N-methylase Trm61